MGTKYPAIERLGYRAAFPSVKSKTHLIKQKNESRKSHFQIECRAS